MNTLAEVKICGMTSLDDAQAAVDLGADYIGFVLYESSPRAVTLRRMARILARLAGTWRAVGVFVDAERRAVEEAIRCGLHAVQIYGEACCETFAGLAVPVWRAIRLENGEWKPRPELWPAARYVADATVPGRHGGTGRLAAWPEAAALARRFPLMLAGGLTPENVASAVAAVKPLGVDAATGVEARPGRKDKDKMKRFIEAVRNL